MDATDNNASDDRDERASANANVNTSSIIETQGESLSHQVHAESQQARNPSTGDKEHTGVGDDQPHPTFP